ETEVRILDRFAVDPHRTLTDQTPRLAIRGRKVKLLHQLADPDVLGDAIDWDVGRNFATLKLALEIPTRPIGSLGAVVLRDDHRGEAFLRLHRMDAARLDARELVRADLGQ